MQKKVAVILAVCIFVLIAVIIVFKFSQKPIVVKIINNFDDCLKAGNPIMESWPRQCRTSDGRSFTEDISGQNGTVSFITSEIKVETPDYTITAAYPVMTMPDANKSVIINKMIKQLVDNEVNSLKRDVAPPEADQVASFLESNYDFYQVTENFISLNLGFSTYYAGAAHPMSYSVPFNYEVERDKELFLEDIFQPQSRYLQEISDYCKTNLRQKLQESLFEEGLAATKDNFSKFVFNNDSIIFLFDPYQVGPYAVGPQEVEIPYVQIENVLIDNGPISRLVGEDE